MDKNFASYRKSYEKNQIDDATINKDPLSFFKQWFGELEVSKGVDEPNVMTLSSVGIDGFPKSRVVLLKEITPEGFVFYTNYNSEKGKAIAHHPKVCLSFFWPNLERQAIIKGIAKKIPPQQSDAYFKSRPRGSQLGAVVSAQSESITSRAKLEERLSLLEKKWEGKPIIRPKHWGGYCVTPISYEFWQGRPNRLHDRIRFSLTADSQWKKERLQP